MTLIFYDPSAFTADQMEEISKTVSKVMFIPVALPVGAKISDVVQFAYVHDDIEPTTVVDVERDRGLVFDLVEPKWGLEAGTRFGLQYDNNQDGSKTNVYAPLLKGDPDYPVFLLEQIVASPDFKLINMDNEE